MPFISGQEQNLANLKCVGSVVLLMVSASMIGQILVVNTKESYQTGVDYAVSAIENLMLNLIARMDMSSRMPIHIPIRMAGEAV